MRWNSFGRSLMFAALGALAAGAWVGAAGPVLGGRWALALSVVGLAAIYVTGLGPSRRRSLGVGVATFVLGCGLAVATRTLSELTFGLAILLAVARSGFLYRMPPARAATIEAVLMVAGLLFARHLAGPSLPGLMLAVWGFLLVQSFFFLVGGMRPRVLGAARQDPFEAAYGRALALLEEPFETPPKEGGYCP